MGALRRLAALYKGRPDDRDAYEEVLTALSRALPSDRTYGLALDATGVVQSLDVLAYRESHGDAIRLASWRAQFTGKRASDPVKIDADIRNISGATLSCRHVTEGVHRLLLVYQKALAHG